MIRSKAMFLLAAISLGLALVLTACTPSVSTTTPAARASMRIAALRGPTGMGLVGLMAAQEEGTTRHDYTFSLAGTPDDIVALISSGQVDIAALPTNLAAVLYQRTGGQIRMLAVNTLGVLYILEKGNQVNSMADLAGRTIMATGQGAVPEYVLAELLANGGLSSPAQVEFRSEHSELATLAASGQADLVMLPEPFVTTVLNKNPEFRIALDLTAEWSAMMTRTGRSGQMSMGSLVVNARFVAENPQALADFLEEYQASVDYVNQNPEDAGKEIARFNILADAALAAGAIPNSNIVLIKGAEMIEALDQFFNVLYAANPRSVGGELPDQDFYWLG